MEIEGIKSKRKSIAVQVCQDGHLKVRCPYGMTRAAIALGYAYLT